MGGARYNLLFFGALLAGVAGLVVFNATVDPFDMSVSQSARALDIHKPLVAEQWRLAKPSAVCRLKPALVLLGTSRTQHALDPGNPDLRLAQPTAFNLSYPGASIYELARNLEHSIACGGLREAWVELDYYAFESHRRPAPDFQDDLLMRDSSDRWRPALRRLRLLGSWDTVRASVTELRLGQQPLEFEADGRTNDLLYERKIRNVGGLRAAFVKSESTQYADPYFVRLPADRPIFRGPSGAAALGDLVKLMQVAEQNHVRLRFFFAPLHVRQLELFREMGLWNDIEDWRSSVVTTIDAESRKLRMQPAPDVWDFAGYNSITTEPVPLPGDAVARMSGYWESSHFRKSVGDLMIARMLLADPQSRGVPADFGVLVTPENMPARIEAIREQSARYREAHPVDLAEIAKTVAHARTLAPPLTAARGP